MRSASLSPIFYLDTSALVKRYVTEAGYFFIQLILRYNAN